LRILAVIIASLLLPVAARATPVTWEARGVVEFSTLDQLFFETFMPELVGTTAGDPFRLLIRFDTDAAADDPVLLPGGGRTRSFDATLLVMSLEVTGRGTHVFTIDRTVPPGTHSSIGIIDNQVLVDPDLVRDGVQFQHNYLTSGPDGVQLFQVLTGFFSANTNVIDGLFLPLKPHPALDVGLEHFLSINANPPEIGNLQGNVTSLVHLPEPGSLALCAIGLGVLGAVRRRAANA
jgi:hypothetical protein